MKNIITGFSLFMASVGFAAGNKMSMVTYFPVPYVAYSRVAADKQLDVGLTQNGCNMSLGCTESDVNLKAHTVNLSGGRLDLNGGRGIVGDSISLGAVTAGGQGQVKFKNVRINNGDMQSLNADDMRVSALHLFGKEFPKCQGKGGSDGKMSWQPLSLQGAGDGVRELYLVCGNTVDGTCKPTHNGEETYTDEYGVVLTWDYNDCEYIRPPVGTKRCLTALKYCSWPVAKCGMQWGQCGIASPDKSIPQCNSPKARPTKMLISRHQLGEPVQQTLKSYYDIPDGCNVNGECNSCVLGQRYVYNQGGPTADANGYKMWVYGEGCQNGSLTDDFRMTLQVQYAMCVQVQGDECPVESHKDCRQEDWSSNSPDPGLQPLNPNISLTE